MEDVQGERSDAIKRLAEQLYPDGSGYESQAEILFALLVDVADEYISSSRLGWKDGDPHGLANDIWSTVQGLKENLDHRHQAPDELQDHSSVADALKRHEDLHTAVKCGILKVGQEFTIDFFAKSEYVSATFRITNFGMLMRNRKTYVTPGRAVASLGVDYSVNAWDRLRDENGASLHDHLRELRIQRGAY